MFADVYYTCMCKESRTKKCIYLYLRQTDRCNKYNNVETDPSGILFFLCDINTKL